MIKLIATDLDGTLLNDKKEISTENLAAIRYAHSRGVKVVLCTGRPYQTMKEFVTSIGLTSEDDYVITFNGGQVQKAKNGEVLFQEIIDQKSMSEWAKEMERLHLPLNIIDGEYVYEPMLYPTEAPSMYVPRFKDLATKQVDYLSYFDEGHAFNKFVSCADQSYLDQLIPEISANLTERFSVYKSQDTLLEIMPKGVTKAYGLAHLGKILGIQADEMMTIGDQANDMDMIRYAGVGVAMGNAIEPLKEVADFVTVTNEEHGVAEAIYHFVK